MALQWLKIHQTTIFSVTDFSILMYAQCLESTVLPGLYHHFSFPHV